MKEKVFISAALPIKTMEELHAKFDCKINTEKDIIQGLKKANIDELKAVVTLLSDRIDEIFFQEFPSVKMVANYAVGYNNIDIESASKNQVYVTNTLGVLTETSADTAFALLMTVARKILSGDQLARSGNWNGWAPTQLLGKDIFGSSLGIVGLGRIGKAMAKRAHGFGMNIHYWNRTRLSFQEENKLGLKYLPLDQLMASMDFISLHVAYNSDTHHLINSDRLAAMRPDAFLINTSRGAVIDEKALINALQERSIAGAGLDVFEQEPFIPEELRALDNTVLLPHLGSASLSTREKMGSIVIENLSDFFSGKTPTNSVNEM